MANLCSVNVHENDIFFINPEINTLHGENGIYHLISKEFSENYSPESHLIKIKIG